MYLIVISSFSDPFAVLRGEVTFLPVDPSLIGYQSIFNFSIFWRSYLNSLIITVSGTFLSVSITLMAAYSMSHNFFGKRFINVVILLPMF